MKFKAVVMTLFFAAGVAASVAVAKGPPPGKGKDKGSTTASASTSTSTESKGKGKGKSKKTVDCKPTVSFILKGEFLAGSGATATPASAGSSASPAGATGSFSMKVTQANAHGRKLAGTTVVISVDSKTKFKRRGNASLEDFEAGDWLNVHVRACKAPKSSGTGTTTSSTTSSTQSTTTSGSSGSAGPLADGAILLAKQVIGKPGKAGSTDSTQTTTTQP